jgi:transketolase
VDTALSADTTDALDLLSINTIRTLAIDAVEKANSGHAGTPMGIAPMAYVLWQYVMRYDPSHPEWPNRDRFVLSAGHASMLLYSLIYLSGIKRMNGEAPSDEPAVSLDDIKRFRQIDSVTPGHPEYGHTTGVEVTTGPLGQGCGNSVGMAIASRWLGARYNTPAHTVFDFDVYVICSDGDLMEGVASEAASLAGFLGLDNLCWIYDDNTVTIEGHTDLAFNEDVATRFKAYGWNIIHVEDVNDLSRCRAALDEFQATKGQPTLIIVKSIIGYGAPDKQNTSAIHSDALGAEEVRKTKAFYGWPQDNEFYVPDGVTDYFAKNVGARGRAAFAAWKAMMAEYGKVEPTRAREIAIGLKRGLPEGWDNDLPTFKPSEKGIATREASGQVLNALAAKIPWIVGGAADLAPSTKTKLGVADAGTLTAKTPGGRNMHFGVREHAMGAIVNGMALSKLRAFGSTFLIFSDYMRPTIRLAALMKAPVFHVFTHDSIGVGEDGPTHQPVEQLASLRAIPGLVTLRPADANEVVEAYKVIMQLKDEPAMLVLSRQPLPVFDRARFASAQGLARGAYTMADADDGKPQVILIATGSEVRLCVEAYEMLKSRGIGARVVSMPSWDLFERQDQAYRDSVLPPAIKARVTVEQGSTLGWDRYAGCSGTMIGMHTFGSSAPLKDLLRKFGFVADRVLEAALHQIEESRAT